MNMLKCLLSYPATPAACMAALLLGGTASAADDADDNSDEGLARQVSNPLADLISVPIQFNYDDDVGNDGQRYTANIQPVIPFDLENGGQMISRTIVPVIYQSDVAGNSEQFGLGDITQSFFFGPKTQELIWGVGPVFQLRTSTDDALGSEKWGAGPTGVILQENGPWMYGLLANHIWSVAGNDNREDLNNSFVQPFIAYHTPTAWTYTLQSESTYYWDTDEASIPINFLVSKIVHFGKQPVSLMGGVGYWADSPDTGPEGVRFRVGLTFLFPK